jgi:hypothetical protein
MNQIILYCKNKESAVFWDVCCNAKCCSSSRCLCAAIIKKAQTRQLFSDLPVRIQKVEDALPFLDEWKEKARAEASRPKRTPLIKYPITRNPLVQKRTPQITGAAAGENTKSKGFDGFGDILRKQIVEEAEAAK